MVRAAVFVILCLVCHREIDGYQENRQQRSLPRLPRLLRCATASSGDGDNNPTIPPAPFPPPPPLSYPHTSVRYFINLTNGIEAVDVLRRRGVRMDAISFFRLQSTHCESRQYTAILENLDNHLLLSLALGYIVVLFDYGCRGSKVDDHRDGIPRSYWWGIEWITFALNHFWDLETADGTNVPMVRGCNTRRAFEEQLYALPKDVRRRIKYFRPYLRDRRRIHLYPVYAKTEHDGDKAFYASLLHGAVDQEAPDVQALMHMPRGDVDAFVQHHVVPDGLHIYRSSDFEGFGRALGKAQPTPEE